MKKLLAIFALLLTIVCSIVLFACEENSNNEIDPNNNANGDEPYVPAVQTTTNQLDRMSMTITGDDFEIGTKINYSFAGDRTETDEVYNILWDNGFEVERWSSYKNDMYVLHISLTQDSTKELTIEYLFTAEIDKDVYTLYRIKGDKAEEIEYSVEVFNEGSSLVTFSSHLGYRFVFAKKHVHDYYHVDGKEATLVEDGYVEYYICQKCSHYFDKDYNKIETKVIERPIKDFVLLINGKVKYDLVIDESTLNSVNYRKFYKLENVNLKKGDLIEIASKENNSIKCNIFAAWSYSFTNNLFVDNRVCSDIDSATISVGIYYNEAYVIISGRENPIYITYRGQEYWPDENGVIEIKNLIASDSEDVYFNTRYYYNSSDQLYFNNDYTKIEIDENSNQKNIRKSYNYIILPKGLYNITLDTKTNKCLAVKTSDDVNEMFNGCLWHRNVGSRLRQNSNNSNEATTEISVSDYNINDEFWFGEYYYPVGGLSISEGSEQYISLNSSATRFTFLEKGNYTVYLNINTYEIRVEWDEIPVPFSKIDLAKGNNVSYLYLPMGGAFKETDESGVYEYSQECLLYKYDQIYLVSINDCEVSGKTFVLFEESDTQYASISYSTLYFEKSGIYRFKIHNGTNTAIDIEFVRELTKEEELSHIELSTNKWTKNMIENPNNTNELCILNQTINEPTAICAKEIYSNYNKDILFTTIDMTSSNKSGIIAPGIIYITEAGTYNIYVNKLTHEVRVEEVA